MKVGIIGCGSIARQRHAHEYGLNGNTTIAGFYDFVEQRAADMVSTFGGKVYRTVDELLADPEIDLVSVCVANAYHAEITIKALEAGKNVLCEKPMAVTYEQCLKMVETAEKCGKRLFIGHNQRLTPAHRKAKELIASGKMGKVLVANPKAGKVIVPARRAGASTRERAHGSSGRMPRLSVPWRTLESTRSTSSGT